MEEVVLYSTGCPMCKMLKQQLDRRGIPYIENNDIEEMKSLGIKQAPQLKTSEGLLNTKEALNWIRRYVL